VLIGVDWGGTKIEVVAMEADGTELLRSRELTPRGDYEGCLHLVRELVEKVEGTLARTGSVGIGIPGSIDPTTGQGKGGSSTWINGKPIIEDLHRILNRPLRIENDADCFAASEARDGAGRNHRVVFGVILASGAGAGVAVDQVAHHGPNNSAGDWGHSPLPYATAHELPGDGCYCGKRGCMETWVSGYSFVRDYERGGGPPGLSPANIASRMRDGESEAMAAWDRYVDRVGRGLSVVVNALDPDVFVLGGGMSNIPELQQDLPAAIARWTFSPVFITPVVQSLHGDSSGVRGAAWLWQE
jgi:fructokinase